ncbi:hypothetical protein ACFL0Z_01565, partial [Patescibacteria group bacterium]
KQGAERRRCRTNTWSLGEGDAALPRHIKEERYKLASLVLLARLWPGERRLLPEKRKIRELAGVHNRADDMAHYLEAVLYYKTLFPEEDPPRFNIEKSEIPKYLDCCRNPSDDCFKMEIFPGGDYGHRFAKAAAYTKLLYPDEYAKLDITDADWALMRRAFQKSKDDGSEASLSAALELALAMAVLADPESKLTEEGIEYKQAPVTKGRKPESGIPETKKF